MIYYFYLYLYFLIYLIRSYLIYTLIYNPKSDFLTPGLVTKSCAHPSRQLEQLHSALAARHLSVPTF